MANTIINLANCGVQGNTGGTFCNLEPVRILYMFAVPKGTVVPQANSTSSSVFATYVKSQLYADSKTARWQMTPKLVEFKDNTKDPNTEDLDGWINTTQWLPYDWEFRFANGFSGATMNVFQVWRNYINQQQELYDFLFVDANNLWFGTSGTDSSSNTGCLASVAVSNITVYDWKQSTTKTTNMYKIRIMIQNNSDLNQNWTGILCSTPTSTFKALTEVSVTAGTTAITTTHIYVSGRIGGNTLGKQFGATLAAGLTAFKITDTTNGAKTWTTSAVAYDSTNDQYNITGSWSASNTGDTVTVEIAAPSIVTVTPYFVTIVSEGSDIYSYTAP